MKTLNKTIGIILLILPFVGGMAYFVHRDGVVLTLAYLAGCFLGVALGMSGLYFLTKRD